MTRSAPAALMNYLIAINYLKDSDPILGRLIDRIGACQLNQYEPEGDLFFKGVNFRVLKEQEGEKKTEEHLTSLLDDFKKLIDSQ